MFCTNCGSQFEDGNAFCPNCGTKVETVAQPVVEPAPVAAPVEVAPVAAAPVAAAPVYATPVEPAPAPAPTAVPVAPVAPVQPVYAATPVATPIAGADNELAKSCMIMGIVAVACCITYYFAFVGIIFGAIGLSKAKKFMEDAGQLFGKAKVGKYLSLGGLIGGCVLTGITLFYILMMVIAAIGSNY
ncbi:zinc ribbon protein [Ruminococcaceae bacterium R-25]|nr:zinc ribbon protein [Ruminococcaceae bacterium R-25]SUQ11382.1 zinc-ribbon domain-containing protein [Oscillospiraceae bacterium]